MTTPSDDPTMEEILASIRKIISEDQPGTTAKPAAFRADVADAGILELTEEVAAEDRPPISASRSAETPPDSRDPVLSDSSRELIDRAFETLDKASSEYLSFAGDRLEPVFASAVQDAVANSLQEWVNGHEAELITALTPMLRDWMDGHLPRLVENVLKQELGRAVSEHLRRRLS